MTSYRLQINIQEVHLEKSYSSTMRLVTASTRSSLLDLWTKYFVWRLTLNHLFKPYEMYYSTLRAININGGSLAFVNSSHHWLVIKRCISMFNYKSYIHMARLTLEWSSERDKKTLDLVQPSGLQYQDCCTHHLYGDLTHRLLSKHGPIFVRMFELGNIPMKTTFYTM